MVKRRYYRRERDLMAGKIVRLVCITLMSLWLTGKLIVFSPLLAIPLIGATILFMINQIKEIEDENRKRNKNNKRHKKVVKKSTKS